MKDSKNQIIRSMKSYEVGGATEDSCMETVLIDGEKKRRRKSNCGKTKKIKTSRGGIGVGNVIGGILGIGAAGAAGYGLKKLLKKEQKGGSVGKKK